MSLSRNPLSLHVYASGTTLLNDPDDSLKLIKSLTFSKQYPMGIFGSGSFFVPRPVLREWLVSGALRFEVRNSLDTAYEGYLSGPSYLWGETEEGVSVPLAGACDHILMRQTWRRLWADQRLDEAVWQFPTAALNAFDVTLTKGELDRNRRLKLLPKNVQFANNEFIRVSYSMPTGELVKRVIFDYNFQEAAQAWTGALYGVTGATLPWTITASGTGSQSITLGTPSNTIVFYLQSTSGGNQTPPDDGTVYLEIKNLTVYCETGARDMELVAKDIAIYFSSVINADTQYIQAAGSVRNLVPFIEDDRPSLADILEDAIAPGDGAAPPNRWAFGLLASQEAATKDGKPPLFLEQYPNTSDHEYILRRGANLISDIEVRRDYGAVRNWIPVRYLDEKGWEHWVTPDDDASLKDQDSIDRYGRRDVDGGLDAGYMSAANALAFGQLYLSLKKKPVDQLAQPAVVQGYILDKNGNEVPTSLIEPGKRALLEGWKDEETGAPLRLVITATDYQHDDESCAVTTGIPLGPMMIRGAGAPIIGGALGSEAISTGGDSAAGIGGGGFEDPEKLNFYKTKLWKKAVKLGLASESQRGKLTAKEKKALKRAVRKRLG